jgi:ubiquinone biosynthesis protein
MMDLWLNQVDLASLVPPCFAKFRPIVLESVRFFVEHLSDTRLARIFAEQAALDPDADVSKRLLSFINACPALHKLAQVIAHDRRLDLVLRRRLQTLESMSPRTPMSQLQPVLQRELGPFMHRYALEVGRAPLVEGSVAVIVPCTFTESRKAPREPGVLKILKPGIERDLEEDLQIIARFADDVDAQRSRDRVPPLAYRDLFDEVRNLLLHEIQLDHEQAHLRSAAKRLRGCRDAMVPRVLDFSTPRITAMQRLFGVKVTEVPASDPRRPALAATIARTLLSDVFLSREPVSVFHADPHAGNLLACDDGRLAILDWSLTGQIRSEQQSAVARLSLAAMARDAFQMELIIQQLSSEPVTASLVRRVVRRAVDDLNLFQLPSPQWTMHLLDNLALAGVRFPPELLLLRKACFTLEGVIADVCPDRSLEQILTSALLERFVLESPLRLISPMQSRDFATHLSNADLLEFPFSLARGWVDAFARWSIPNLALN